MLPMNTIISSSLLACLLPLLAAMPAAAADVVPEENFAAFLFSPTTAELKAAHRYGRDAFARGEAAHRPVDPRVARASGTVLISLQSVAVCTRVKACPLLVFRNIAMPPVLQTSAFENVIVAYRPAGTFLVLRLWDKVTECRISDVRKAICKDITARRR